MRKVEAVILINTNPHHALNAFTELDLLRGWWGVERALIEKRPGGVYALGWNITEAGFKYISSGTVRSYEKGRLLEIENLVYFNPERPILGPMTLQVKVENKGGATELSLCQDGYQNGPDWDWYYEAVKDAWPKVLVTLKEYLEKQKQ